MKRSAPLQRRTPLRSTKALKRSAFGLASAKTQLKRSELKARIKKPTVADGSKYLAACRGEPCFLQISHVCCGDWGTVVPAHSNQSIHGKGMGIKAQHRYTIPCCMTCHIWLDTGSTSRETKVALFNAALHAWEPVRAKKMGIEVNQLEEVA